MKGLRPAASAYENDESAKGLAGLLIFLAVALALSALLVSLGGDGEVYGQVLAQVTPRGTSPLPPGDPTAEPATPPTFTPIATQRIPTSTPSPNTSTSTPVATQTAPSPEPNSSNGTSPTGSPTATAGSSSETSLAFPTPVQIAAETIANVVPGETTRLASSDGTVVVTVPAGGLEPNTELALRLVSLSEVQMDSAIEAGLITTNLAFALSAKSIDATPLGPSIDTALEVEILYSENRAAGIVESSLGLYYFQPSPQGWALLPDCSRNLDTNVILCKINRLSTYLLAGRELVSSASGGSGLTRIFGAFSWPIIVGLALAVFGGVYMALRPARGHKIGE